jgi:hypothetical protein
MALEKFLLTIDVYPPDSPRCGKPAGSVSPMNAGRVHKKPSVAARKNPAYECYLFIFATVLTIWENRFKTGLMA